MTGITTGRDNAVEPARLAEVSGTGADRRPNSRGTGLKTGITTRRDNVLELAGLAEMPGTGLTAGKPVEVPAT